MNDSGFVCRLQCFGDLLGDREGFVNGDRTARNPVSERRPFNQLQHQRTGALRLFQAVNLGDVRMVQAGKNLRFALEPCEPIRISRKRLGQNLERHLAVQLGIGGLIDLSHPALADEGGDVVMAQSGADVDRHK